MVHLPRFYVYLLLSDRGEIYCGYTNNIRRRLKEHNAASNSGWTRGRERWHLLALKMFLDRHSALLVEQKIKKLKYDKRNWIKRTGRLRTLCDRHGIRSTHLR